MATMTQHTLNPIQFIEDALFCTTTQPALSYSDPDQKWIIRQHLIPLFQDFPSLKPAIGSFTHNDGTEVKLFNISGNLHVSCNASDVPVIIWVHELYPQIAPIVYVNVKESVYENHPFVDSSSCCIVCSYLINWKFMKCSISGLVRSLMKLFSINHPSYISSMVTKTEIMDQLTRTIYYDTIAMASRTEEEIERLSMVQSELVKRAEIAGFFVNELQCERENLEGRVKEVSGECDKLRMWLKENDDRGFAFADSIDDDAFEAFDEMSERMIHLKAADNAIEDLMYALDRAVEEGVVDFKDYVKQVRLLAREQFLHRAKVVEVENMGFLSFAVST